MGFPWTLQKYILRETGKAFLLTAAALTAVLGLGGGVLQMISLGEVTPGQLGHILALVLPVSAALTLPIAALFSATVTYGRLSADNEFSACRASGVNLYVLLLPTVVISLLSAIVTFAFINFVIPGMVRSLNEFITSDISVIVRQRLKNPRGIQVHKGYRLHADDAELDPESTNRVLLSRVAFLQVEGEQWSRVGTARQVNLEFRRDGQRLWASGTMHEVSFYDGRNGRFTDVEEQTLPGAEVPIQVPRQIKFLNLIELLRYAANPASWPDVSDAFGRLRYAIARRAAYQALASALQSETGATLDGDASRLTVHAQTVGLVPNDGGLELNEVSLAEERKGQRRVLTANRGLIEMIPGETLAGSIVRFEAYEVRSREAGAPALRGKETFGPYKAPESALTSVQARTDEELSRQAVAAERGDPVEEKRLAAVGSLGNTGRRIQATIHERLAFSASVFVLVVLGAALGIILRGSHVLTAFGISFVPSLVVIICIVMGRQMAINARTHGTGLLVMWAGILIVAGLDLLTLTRFLRR